MVLNTYLMGTLPPLKARWVGELISVGNRENLIPESPFTCKDSTNIESRNLQASIILKVYGILSVNFFPVTNFYNENSQNTVFNATDDSVIAYPVFPEFTQFGTFKCLTDTARIVKHSQTTVKKLQNALRNLRIKFIQFPHCCGVKLNRPGHNVS